MPKKPRKVEKKIKPIIEPVAKLEEPLILVNNRQETTPIEVTEGTIELPLLETLDDTTITVAPKPSKREQIDKLLANPCPFYPDPTRLQYATEMWPWLKQLAELLE